MTVRWLAVAGVMLIAALALHATTLAQVHAQHIKALPPQYAPQPSIDPIDLLATANALGFISGHRVSGEVRELSSGRTLANVWVIALWEYDGLSGYVCSEADTTRSDPAGHFELPTPSRTFLQLLFGAEDPRLRLFVYRPDYELVRLEFRQILLRPLEDSAAKRLAALIEIDQSVFYCPPYSPHHGAHDEHFRPLLVEMTTEVQTLPDDSKAVGYFLGQLRQQTASAKSASH